MLAFDGLPKLADPSHEVVWKGESREFATKTRCELTQFFVVSTTARAMPGGEQRLLDSHDLIEVGNEIETGDSRHYHVLGTQTLLDLVDGKRFRTAHERAHQHIGTFANSSLNVASLRDHNEAWGLRTQRLGDLRSLYGRRRDGQRREAPVDKFGRLESDVALLPLFEGLLDSQIARRIRHIIARRFVVVVVRVELGVEQVAHCPRGPREEYRERGAGAPPAQTDRSGAAS